MPGWLSEWPSPSTMMNSASGQARCRSHAVVAGHAFGSEHHLRLNFTLSPDRLNEAAHRLVSALT